MLDLRDVDERSLRAWRETWTWSTATRTLRLELIKAFFRFAVLSEWIATSPAENLRSPKQDDQPIVPLSQEELEAILEAAGIGTREQALILLMRFSGLSLLDAVTLGRSAIDDDGNLTVRRHKSGELVVGYLHPKVSEALHRFPPVSKQYFFWTGKSQPETAVKYWRERMNQIARKAKVENFRPHRLRDAFAVELLVAGASIEDLSTLLAHRSITITEKYYAPWNRLRRDRLVALLQKAHRRNPLLRKLE